MPSSHPARPLALAAALAGLGSGAAAERLSFDCHFTSRCSGRECQAHDLSHRFKFDTAAGRGLMFHEGRSWAGRHLASDGLHHFVFANAVGAELVTIAEGGVAVYSGHMADGDAIDPYRLDGSCTQGAG